MELKWKLFKKTFPDVCTKCDSLSNSIKEYCENCGSKDSLRGTTKADWKKYSGKG